MPLKPETDLLFEPENAKIFFANTDRTDAYIETIKKIAGKSNIFLNTDTSFFRYMDVGCGNGELSSPLIKYFFTGNMLTAPTHCLFLDPNLQMLQKCEKSNNDLCGLHNDRIRFEYANTKFENFLTTKGHSIHGTFNMILCSHVFYYFEDCREILNNIRKIIADNGIILLIIKSAQCQLYNEKKMFFSDKPPVVKKHIEFDTEIESILRKNNITYLAEPTAYKISVPLDPNKNHAAQSTNRQICLKLLSYILNIPMKAIMSNNNILKFLIKIIEKNTVSYTFNLQLHDTILVITDLVNNSPKVYFFWTLYDLAQLLDWRFANFNDQMFATG